MIVRILQLATFRRINVATRRRPWLAGALVVAFWPATAVWGAEQPAAAPAVDPAEPAAGNAAEDATAEEDAAKKEEEEEVAAPLTLDLGAFTLKDLRPTRDVTAELKFSLHLELRPETSEAEAQALKHWKLRLRDQTITAVRSSTMTDFADPELVRMQRIILLRVNRLLPAPMVHRVLLTRFTLGDL